jgi:hypothetical protein
MHLDLSYDMHYISRKSLKLPYNVPISHFQLFFTSSLRFMVTARTKLMRICLIVETTGT